MNDVAVTTEVKNPFRTENAVPTTQAGNALVAVAAQRELAEVQGAILMARRFPRDPEQAMDLIIKACMRPGLAEVSQYEYARGGTEIGGPSIRLAETIAQCWGNLQFTVRELEQRDDESTVEALCWDLETNVRQSKVFQVSHWRHTRQGKHRLTDPRDIYEAVANQGARRLRACILGVIPGDVIEAAVEQCNQTLAVTADTSPDALKRMAAAFAKLGVTLAQLEAFGQCKLEAFKAINIVRLNKIYQSIVDGMSTPAQWFQPSGEDSSAAGATGSNWFPDPSTRKPTGNEALKGRITGKGKSGAAAGATGSAGAAGPAGTTGPTGPAQEATTGQAGPTGTTEAPKEPEPDQAGAQTSVTGNQQQPTAEADGKAPSGSLFDQEGGVDPDDEAAVEIVNEMGQCTTEAALITVSTRFRTIVRGWRTTRKDLFDKVEAAATAKQRSLRGG